MRREMASEEPLIVSEIDRLILIDRECDLVTPNVSQLTYEGMIDEVFGINNSMFTLYFKNFCLHTYLLPI